MQSEVVDKIKKLLRLAKNGAGTPEGASARAIAERLMEKHGIHVSPDEHKEIVISEGAHWRSQVLTATARSQGCRVFKDDGNHKQLAVIGKQLNVSRAIDMYMMLVPKIVTACNRMWKNYAEREFRNKSEDAIDMMERVVNALNRQTYDENEYSLDKLDSVMRVWWRMFMNAAADEIILKYMPPAVIKKPMYYEPLPMEFIELQRKNARANKKASPAKIEREMLDADTLALALLLGDEYKAQSMVQTAKWQARQTVTNMSPVEYRAGRLLLAASSFLPVPPPPPKSNRFSYLDYE